MNKRTSIRRMLALGMASLCLSLSSSAAIAQAAPVKIKFALDWRFEGPSALFLLPLAKGYFAQEGLDVTIDAGAGSSSTVNRIASGAYDMGFADLGAMIEFIANNQAAATGRMQAVYLVYEQAPLAVFSLKKSNINKPSDLVGKTLGAPIFDPTRKLFSLFTKANNIDAAKLNWKTMEPPLRETLLVRGEVDAVTGFYFTSLMNLNARGVKDEDLSIMQFVDYGVKMYGNAIIANQSFIESNPKAVAAFLRAFTRGAREVIADPDGSIKYVHARDPLINVEVEKRRLRLALDASIGTPNVKANGIGAADKTRVESMVNQIVAAFGLKQSPDPAMMFNASFMPAKSERQVFAK
ncbi:MAG: ABC-type nitrate/sulfonate/bicarbonate transport system, periplasmic component protein [Noviherbaspirillum sp.]|jgi:NitT/TauT family transport system substrate-binding protein|nr:ABC-type nitrate/sulfonate/bicarbonate transport system, periplasmic component protein [Noviherbaspirillum sp.]